jgi:uncharacterized protein YkwD
MLATPAAAGAATAGDRAEARMVGAVNKVRAAHGLGAMRASSSLMGSAGRYSRWLLERDLFTHLSRIQASRRFTALGEALAMHRGRRFDVGGTLRRWMASPSHRAIVLSPTMRWIGTGVTRGRYGAVPTTMWVLHTGRLGTGASPRVPGVQLP